MEDPRHLEVGPEWTLYLDVTIETYEDGSALATIDVPGALSDMPLAEGTGLSPRDALTAALDLLDFTHERMRKGVHR